MEFRRGLFIMSKENLLRQALIKGSKTDEWYTPMETVQTMLKVFPPKKGDHICLPFDTKKKSNFYKVITKDYDTQAIHSITDWLTKDYEYSNKDEIIERCIDSGKPSVLVLPIESLGGVKRHELFKRTNIAIYVPTKRIKFISETGDDSKSPAHHSIVMLVNAERTELIFEHQLEGDKNGKSN